MESNELKIQLDNSIKESSELNDWIRPPTNNGNWGTEESIREGGRREQ